MPERLIRNTKLAEGIGERRAASGEDKPGKSSNAGTSGERNLRDSRAARAILIKYIGN